MTEKEKLYETLGELLYVIAKADGIIQNEEKVSLAELVKEHAWAEQITWSFDYEALNNSSIDDVYSKVINFCHRYGPAPEYYEFVTSMKLIADATNGIDKDEEKVINSFSRDLIERFKKDIEKINNV